MRIYCLGNQVFVPSRHEHFDRSIASTVIMLQNLDREMLPIPTPEHNAGKCNRGCCAHFNPMDKSMAASDDNIIQIDERIA
jgi:hypothetical protein